MFHTTRKNYQHEGRQAKSVAHQTDYEEPKAKGKFNGTELSKSNQIRLDKSRGPAQRGLALFRFTFVRTKANPGARGWVSPGRLKAEVGLLQTHRRVKTKKSHSEDPSSEKNPPPAGTGKEERSPPCPTFNSCLPTWRT